MSKLLRPNVLRAVRLLPEAVRIGNVPRDKRENQEKIPREPEAGNHPVDLLSQLNEELSLLKTRLEESEREKRDLAFRASVFEEELSRERVRLEEERQKMVSALETEGAAARKKAVSEGFEEGRKAGYEQGIENARKEAAKEAGDKVRSAVSLLESVHRSLEENLGALCSLQMPRLIRMWEFLLSRMLRKEVSIDGETAVRMLRGVLERISDKERVIVYLNPEDVDAVRGRKDEFSDLLRGIRHLEFIPDGNVDAGSCIVETNLGIYDARWRIQLEQVSGEIEHLFIEGGNGNDGSF
ncbi:FliH/SctL family protein [Aminivibrio sp.]|uniref:FliH/SctL family protein n=1 Tax=Aminivibrio sp. TaxID=1872489 RepID=UPI001A596FF2|nr:FliH/SctL family protein [Aminivibrio sp.]MBL3538773.1 flagellar assembly protein FliH [Aminivibrio sp.]